MKARPAIGANKIRNYSGIKIHYYDHGKGETVVLLAALGRSVSDFNELADDLIQAGYRTIAVELRGVGKTTGDGLFKETTLLDYANDIAYVIKTLPEQKDDKVHVIGHALGNRIARALSKNHPQLIKSVTLIAAGGFVPISKHIKRAMAMVPLGFLPERIRVRNAQKALFAPGHDVPDYWISGWHFRAVLSQAKATISTPREEWWSGGDAPILILQAEYDVIAPKENAEAMKMEFGDRVTVVKIPDAGHAMLPEQPLLIAESIIAFLRRIDG